MEWKVNWYQLLVFFSCEAVSDMYVYEGHDYRETTVKDQEAFDNMMAGNYEKLLTAEQLTLSVSSYPKVLKYFYFRAKTMQSIDNANNPRS